MSSAKAFGTPMSPLTSFDKDEKGNPVDETKTHGMIGSLFYLTASRPDIMFSVCKCVRFQSGPKESHLTAINRLIRYGSNNFKIDGFSDVDLEGDKEERKSTSRTCQLLEKALISWNSKKLGSIALSTTEKPFSKNPSMAKHSKNLSVSTRKITRSKGKPSYQPPEQVDQGPTILKGLPLLRQNHLTTLTE
nr:secreted RxLR effector protein 161-like [Nicotiana tomentosiformis]